MLVDEAAGDELELRSRRGVLTLAATVAASAMASLDATVVNVALPQIGTDLDADVAALQWVLTGYLLALASMILLGGALGDRFGRRRIFVVGTVWFAAASLGCGMAPSVEVLVAARILQGIGGALLTPGSLAILQASFRRVDRAPAVGAWSGLGGVAGAIGPLVGGLLVDGPGWRWAFLLNVPVAVCVIVLARAVPETRDRSGARLDFTGAGYGVIALGALTMALTGAGERGWTEPAVLAAATVATGAAVAFVVHIRRTPHPLVPPSLFRDRVFSVVNVGTVFLYAAIGLTFFLVSYQLQVVGGWTALGAGLALVPATVLMLALSAPSGALADKIGPRWQLGVGPLVAAAGLALLTRIDGSVNWVSDVLPGAIVFGVGLATFVAPLTATVMAAADPAHVSVASAVNNAAARAAALAGIAVIPVVAGLSSAVGGAEVTSAVRAALFIAAGVTAAASPVMFFGLGAPIEAHTPARRHHCAVDGPPLQADPQRCPAATTAR